MAIEIYNDNFSAMGTRFGIVLPGVYLNQGNEVSLLIREELNRLENKISRFIQTSKVSHLNRFACKYPVIVDDELWDILKTCVSYHNTTLGAFDITLKSMADYWNVKGLKQINIEEPHPDLEALLLSVGMNKIEMNEENISVFFKNSNVEIDLGAIGKGLALKYVNEILAKNGIENAFVSFGESSILALGSHPNGNKWKIGLPDYSGREGNVYTLEAGNSSVSVSGNTMNNKITGRVNIINPFTGYPVEEKKTILVADKDPVLAEVFSTSFMILSDEQIQDVLTDYPHTFAVKIEYTQDIGPRITEYKEKILS